MGTTRFTRRYDTASLQSQPARSPEVWPLAPVWPAVSSLPKDLHDLRSVIGNDLTEATQSQVRGTTVVQSAASDGSRPAIDAALAETRALIQQLSPTAGQ